MPGPPRRRIAAPRPAPASAVAASASRRVRCRFVLMAADCRRAVREPRERPLSVARERRRVPSRAMSAATAIVDRPADRRSVLLVVSGLMLVMLLASLDQTIVSTALPTIVGELGGLQHLSWVVTAYLLAVTVVTPLYGKLGDLYGRKRVLQGALTLFLIGSALCGLAHSMTELIAFRAIQGLGGGGLMVSAQAAIGDVVPPRERGKWSGLFGAVFGVSSVAGP